MSGTVVINVVREPEASVFTAREAADRFRVNKATWWRWVQRGIAPKPVYFGTSPRWRIKDLQQMIEEAGR